MATVIYPAPGCPKEAVNLLLQRPGYTLNTGVKTDRAAIVYDGLNSKQALKLRFMRDKINNLGLNVTVYAYGNKLDARLLHSVLDSASVALTPEHNTEVSNPFREE